jgi:uncharacterized protein YneF (UPF0154 family)
MLRQMFRHIFQNLWIFVIGGVIGIVIGFMSGINLANMYVNKAIENERVNMVDKTIDNNQLKMNRLLEEVRRNEEIFKQSVGVIHGTKIGDELIEIYNTMPDLYEIMNDIANYDIPSEFVAEHKSMTREEFNRYADRQEEYLIKLDDQFRDIIHGIVLDEKQIVSISVAKTQSVQTDNGISADRANAIKEAAEAEADRRSNALEVLKMKFTMIENSINIARAKAEAVME